MQNMSMHRRVLKTVNPDGEFACFVNRAHGLNYREKYSLVQEHKGQYPKHQRQRDDDDEPSVYLRCDFQIGDVHRVLPYVLM
jgi:hypothetical protein